MGNLYADSQLLNVIYIRATDPGAVGPGQAWLNILTNTLSIRNLSDSGWIALSGTGAALATRLINTTAPLTGGGDLSADRTLNISTFVASGASHAKGIVPDPGASGGTTKFLREDATFAVPPSSDPISSVYPAFTVTGNSDEFDDASFTGWTAVNSGNFLPTLTEINNVLSINMPGGNDGAALQAWVKAQAFVVGDWIEIAVRGMGNDVSARVGVVFANGNTYGAGAQIDYGIAPFSNLFIGGSYTNYNTDGGTSFLAPASRAPYTDWFLRLKYTAANTFVGYVSCDGISFVNITGDQSRTLTPTHGGFFVTSYSGVSPFNFCIRYVRFGNG
jgi:hypothetical protein